MTINLYFKDLETVASSQNVAFIKATQTTWLILEHGGDLFEFEKSNVEILSVEE